MTARSNSRVQRSKFSFAAVLLAAALSVVAVLAGSFTIAEVTRRFVGIPNVHKLDATRNIGLAISPFVDYRLDLANEDYFVYLPKNFDLKKSVGLIVYSSPSSTVDSLPDGWEDILAKRNLILIAPQRAGNDCPQGRRLGLCVLGALSMIDKYPIDRRRVYAAGLSGGARIASQLAFYQPDLFVGTIQSCGSDFYRRVSREFAKSTTDTKGNPYGYVEVPKMSRFQAWRDVHFVLLTGLNDFREGNIRDIYAHGFLADGYKCLLIDDPNMGHRDCSAENLDKALYFIGDRAS